MNCQPTPRPARRRSLLPLRLLLPLGLLSVWLLLPARPALAHPLGNFSVNRYSRLVFSRDQVQLVYVLDMAEIPTFQSWPQIDSDGDTVVSETERLAYQALLAETLRGNLRLRANGRSLALVTQTASLSFPPGQGDLPTLRLEATFQATLPSEATLWQLAYEDGNYAQRLGWREIVVTTNEGVDLLDSTVSAQDISQGLTQYPPDLLQSPPAVTAAEFQLALAGSTAVAANQPASQPAPALSQERFSTDPFARLISEPGAVGPNALLLILFSAFGLGALHALSPGHGKTIVGAYLVGSRGTAKHALFLGLTTTITHTAGVFLVGLIVLFASRFILPEQLYPWLGVLSGLLVVWIGGSLAYTRWSKWRRPAPQPTELGYHTHLGIGHTHLPPNDHPHGEQMSWRNLLALGVSGGLIPCPSALVVLLSAIALGKVSFGLLLIVVFSLGLASVLTGIGLVLVYAGRLFNGLPMGNGRWGQLLPIASALFITLAGLGITAQAILQTGIL